MNALTGGFQSLAEAVGEAEPRDNAPDDFDSPPLCESCGDDGCGTFAGRVLCPCCAVTEFELQDEGEDW